MVDDGQNKRPSVLDDGHQWQQHALDMWVDA